MSSRGLVIEMTDTVAPSLQYCAQAHARGRIALITGVLCEAHRREKQPPSLRDTQYETLSTRMPP
jgi:hypothetical protein